jgi:hypothetical protein
VQGNGLPLFFNNKTSLTNWFLTLLYFWQKIFDSSIGSVSIRRYPDNDKHSQIPVFFTDWPLLRNGAFWSLIIQEVSSSSNWRSSFFSSSEMLPAC